MLNAGDVLLAQGSARAIEKLKSARRGLLVLDSVVDLPDRSKMPLALAIMAAVIAAAATGAAADRGRGADRRRRDAGDALHDLEGSDARA